MPAGARSGIGHMDRITAAALSKRVGLEATHDPCEADPARSYTTETTLNP
jgi:hypothetical protein